MESQEKHRNTDLSLEDRSSGLWVSAEYFDFRQELLLFYINR
jgi:hypothetical protein